MAAASESNPTPFAMASVRRALVTALAARPPQRFAGRGRPAGVLVALFDRGGEAHVLLTERAAGLRDHRGEMSFPGGRLEAGDATLLAAATREAGEEVGLDPAVVDVIGQLDDQPTGVSGYVITPFVAEVPGDYPWRPAEVEVARVVELPLSALTRPGVRRTEEWRFGRGTVPMTFYEVDGATVWGATARILRVLLARLGLGDP